jgi:hypothetical protein
MPVNYLQISDTIYEVTEAYVAGARACRDMIPHHANPHRDGSQRASDWTYGHDHEAANFHFIDGQDVLQAPRSGETFVIPEDWVETGGPDPDRAADGPD